MVTEIIPNAGNFQEYTYECEWLECYWKQVYNMTHLVTAFTLTPFTYFTNTIYK